jgi:hypothetical protein
MIKILALLIVAIQTLAYFPLLLYIGYRLSKSLTK